MFAWENPGENSDSLAKTELVFSETKFLTLLHLNPFIFLLDLLAIVPISGFSLFLKSNTHLLLYCISICRR